MRRRHNQVIFLFPPGGFRHILRRGFGHQTISRPSFQIALTLFAGHVDFRHSPREVQMLIADLLRNQVTISAEVRQTVFDVASLMVQHNIGAVPVLREGELAGIFTERDLMSRVVAAGKDPARTTVSQVMTEDPLTVAPNDPLETCMTLMKRHGFRHVPVCSGRVLKGIVSLRDILLHDLDEKDDEVRMMRAYMHSTPDAG
jgi:CBS domain-containing protein